MRVRAMMYQIGAIITVLLLVLVSSCGTEEQEVEKTPAVEQSPAEVMPRPDDFVEVETMPEMIYTESPVYPDSVKKDGITGEVWIKSLVDKQGSVQTAIVGKSSGTPALDEAALKAAYKCKFHPAMQDSQPVAVWVTYKVEFTLDEK